MFQENFRSKLRSSGYVVKELAAISGISARTVENWLSKKPSMPRADDAVKIACTLNTSVEFLISGDQGTEYLKNLSELQSSTYSGPQHVNDIVQALLTLDEHELECLRRMLFGGLLGEAGEKRKASG